jgi:hypothetical protein
MISGATLESGGVLAHATGPGRSSGGGCEYQKRPPLRVRVRGRVRSPGVCYFDFVDDLSLQVINDSERNPAKGLSQRLGRCQGDAQRASDKPVNSATRRAVECRHRKQCPCRRRSQTMEDTSWYAWKCPSLGRYLMRRNTKCPRAEGLFRVIQGVFKPVS